MINFQSGLIIFFHDLFTAVWIGGLLMLTLTTLPVLKKVLGHCAETEQIMDAIMKRHSKWVFISMIGLFVTGIMLSRSSAGFNGLFNFNGMFNVLLSVKHILTFLMIALALVRTFGFRSLQKAPDQGRKKISLFLLFLNTLLGVSVLLLSGLLSAL